MPRLNSLGDLIAGVGGATVSIWRRTDPAPTAIATNSGGADWLDDDRAIFQQDAHLDTFDLRSAEIATIDAQGSFELAAGGGVYAAKFFDGVRISNRPGERFIGYGVGDVGPDGSVLLKTPDGLFQGRLIEDLQAHGGASWSGLEGRRPVSSPDLPAAHVVSGSVYGFRRFGDFCCYLAEEGARFIVQHLDRPVGKVLAVTPNAFRPDLVLTPDCLVVTYAWQVDEPPHLLRRFIVPVSELTEDLTAPPPAPIPPPRVAVRAWDMRIASGEPWAVTFDVTQPATVTLEKDADDRLQIGAVNSAGEDHTGIVRQLTVEGPAPEPEPEPAMLGRYWLQPNIGSRDLLEMFTRFEGFGQVDVLSLPIQCVLVDEPNAQVNDNTYPNLVAAGAFRSLKVAQIPLVLEGGVVKDDNPAACTGLPFIHEIHTALARVHDAGGAIAAFSMDEPITNSKKCGLTLEQLADRIANYTHACREEGVGVVLLEAWPNVALEIQARFFELLHQRGALPDAYHPDIDHNRARLEGLDPAKFIAEAQKLASRYGVTFGLFVNATIDPVATEPVHYKDLQLLARRLHGIHPLVAQVHVAAWCRRGSSTGPQDIPDNLSPYGLVASLADTRAVFDASQPDQPEPEIDPMDYKLVDYVLHIKGTKPSSAHDKVTAILRDDHVGSIQPNGSFEKRASGTDGPYEQAYDRNGMFLYEPVDGTRWAVAYRVGA